jgi:hypothetical protein
MIIKKSGFTRWLKVAHDALLESRPKRIVLSGPSGFLGRRVLRAVLDAQAYRVKHGEVPGELILLSSSPGTLMDRLSESLTTEEMKRVRASRIDYHTQHDQETWMNQLGALNVGGDESVFMNLAAVAGPIPNRPNAMFNVNYSAPLAAARASKRLEVSHFIQSSTQATASERAGQVPYSKHKSMFDYALSREMGDTNVTTAVLGLLYSKDGHTIGQQRDDTSPRASRSGSPRLNLIDLSLLPWTPILGSGSAPLQPQEVMDAATRLAFLGVTDAETYRPQQTNHSSLQSKLLEQNPRLRIYDAVGPEVLTMLEMLQRFAVYQGKENFWPVHIDYRNMENLLNVKSLGNLNRQFVSLLRSEQDSPTGPVLGDPKIWESLFSYRPSQNIENDRTGVRTIWRSEAKGARTQFDDAVVNGTKETVEGDCGWLRTKLPPSPMLDAEHLCEKGTSMLTLEQAFGENIKKRKFPYWQTILHILQNPRLIPHGIKLNFEILHNLWIPQKFGQSVEEIKVEKPLVKGEDGNLQESSVAWEERYQSVESATVETWDMENMEALLTHGTVSMPKGTTDGESVKSNVLQPWDFDGKDVHEDKFPLQDEVVLSAPGSVAQRRSDRLIINGTSRLKRGVGKKRSAKKRKNYIRFSTRAADARRLARRRWWPHWAGDSRP